MATHATSLPLRYGLVRLATVWLVGCLAAGGWLIATGAGGSKPTTYQTARTDQYLPIEQVSVGQRVATPQTRDGSMFATDVDPATWRKISLRMEDRWPDGTVDVTDVQTLQPPRWVADNHVAVGAKVPLPLDLKEMGEAHSVAEVTAVEPCPPVSAGTGRVVLTTVNHLNCYLFDMRVHGERAPPTDITVTGWHKLYSENRAAWVSVRDLKPGETLRGSEEGLTIDTLARHPGTQRVYNMTVEGEHVYFVSAANVLAHNNNCTPISMDDAIDRAAAHAGDDAKVVVTKGGNVQLIGQPSVDAGGNVTRNISRLDVNPADPHVQQLGPHLNEEVQINGVSQPGDPHTPIDPSTIRPGDHS